ncbi:hypothetical protein ACTXQV_73345, partial [Klebsiella pneumoniae]
FTRAVRTDDADDSAFRYREAQIVNQFRDAMDNSKTVWEEVSGGLDIMKIGNTEMPSRAYVGRFNFKGVDQGKRVGELS